ncbi:MAG: nucleoside hydrolase, partial [Synergistaceae bacterium]|nr:nucleoside hydrolase [Synergistaceae bacterium]
ILVRKILSCFVLVYYSENFEAGSVLTLLKKLRFVFLAAALSCLSSVAFAAPKVILDTDMAYLNDDALAMFVLTQADNAGMLDLIGVTTVGGNVFVPEATTATLRQLELIGRHDIPVYQGTDEPLAGFRNMREEARLYGMPIFCGAYWDFSHDDFTDLSKRSRHYLKLNTEPPYGYPETRAKELPAWDFIIESVKENPGEVTIMAVGAATNIATALRKYPALAEEAAGIIYMGGDIDVPGNATAAAEVNWFYDPDAIKLCLSANWKKQIIVPDDLSRQIRLTQAFYDRLAKNNNNSITKLILSGSKTFTIDEAQYVWDVLVPVIFLKPEIITDLQERYITVDERPGLNSGRAVSWSQQSNNDIKTGKGFPEGVRKADIVMGIDAPAFWDFYIHMLTFKSMVY